MKKFTLTAAALLAFAAPAFAQQVDHTITGNVWATTDYVNRGISRSDGPALQGRIQANHAPTGLFAGVAGSTVDMNLDKDANVEAVLFGGIQGTYADADYNAKLGYYTYPGGDNDDADYLELALTGGYDFGPFYGSLTWAISPDYINGSGLGIYYGGDIAVPLPYDLKAKAHLGFQYVTDEGPYIDSLATDWGFGLWYNYAAYDVDIGLQYTDTDLDSDECVEECGGRAALMLSKNINW